MPSDDLLQLDVDEGSVIAGVLGVRESCDTHDAA